VGDGGAARVSQNGFSVGASERPFYCAWCKNGYRSFLRLEIALIALVVSSEFIYRRTRHVCP
jgi:hypothetical protein